MASEWLFPSNTEEEEISDKSRNEELFVFGYHCKLFRDDEQANMVDTGTYMIPWMGDEKLKIDRYDGRGHLYDLRPYDADNLKSQPEPVLSEDEAQIEKLCDEERYLELHTDIAEKNMYEEEEWKRYYESLSEGYQAVGFSYDAYGQPQNYSAAEPSEPIPNPDEAEFVPPTELQVPPNVPIPATVKENAIIEKTAKFIAEHGIQMEIVMKTKQSNNPQFLFMHFENHLHPYYKHLVKMIKSKKYIPKSPVKEETMDTHNDSAEGDGGYLHPALMTTNRASPTPQESYKPVPMPKVAIHETPYGQLLQSMSKVNKELAEKNREKETKIKKEIKTEPSSDSYTLPAGVAQPTYGSTLPPPPGIEPVELPSEQNVKQEPRSSSPPAQIVPPPPDLQPIIDRMAMYVAKNGEEFAIVVKSKNDPRFQFLETWHTHYPYYNFKRHLFEEEIEREKKEQEAEEKRKEQEKADILAKGVKFKLKKANKEQESSTTLEKKPVFEDDESGDENDDSDSNIIHRSKSSTNVSGASTPIRDNDGSIDHSKHSEQLERKLAEQRLKDRLAASAREKLSQVDKDKQIKLERKKKAAMFINLLKSKNGDVEEENKATEQTSKNIPSKSSEDTSSSRHKSKYKSRDRSRSRDRDLRSRRSRSRSSSRSKSKKKKRYRSPTPPSAYAVTWRSSARFPHPPPPRYGDMRSRYSRSPSKGHGNRHRSRSRSKGRSSKQRSRSRSPSRSKSKKKKRSKSPKSRKDNSSRRKSSKKKKKRSRSRSTEKKSASSSSVLDKVPDTQPNNNDDDDDDVCIIEPLEEGETRESTLEPGQITDSSDINYKDSSQRSTPIPPDLDTLKHKRKRSVSSDSSRSRSTSPSKILNSINTRKSSSKSKSRSRSRSQSPALKTSKDSINGSHSSSPISHSLSKEGTPVSYTTDPATALSENISQHYNSAGPESTTTTTATDKNVSSYMLDRVRAIIKASREVVHDEDSLLDDS